MPYQDVIGPYLVRRLISEPNGLSEFCEFVSMGVSNFIDVTLRHSLPRLFADCDYRLLEAVAAASTRAKTVALLALDQAPYILSHAFMLQGVGETQRTLKFITRVIKNASQDSSVTTAGFVFTSLLPTLSDIVTHLGDENIDVIEAVSHPFLISRMAQLTPNRQNKD